MIDRFTIGMELMVERADKKANADEGEAKAKRTQGSGVLYRFVI